MRKYHQLNRVERYQIEKQVQEGRVVSQVAKSLGFHRSSIYRELKRNSVRDGRYVAHQAWRKTLDNRRRQDFGPKAKIKGWVEERIYDLLSVGWSPEYICGRLKLECRFDLSAEAIYKFILKDKYYGGSLYKCLRRRGRRKRFRKRSRFIPQWEPRRSIEERCKQANERSEIGHWERDLMVSEAHQGGLIVFTDRKTRFTLLDRVKTRNSEETCTKTLQTFNNNELPCLTITNDNGAEFAKHKKLENLLGIEVYFARPYASWQRGSNENVIGLIRQFIPKGTNVHALDEKRIKDIEYAINTRPRKTLGYKTPFELFYNKDIKLCPKKRHWRYEEQSLRNAFG